VVGAAADAEVGWAADASFAAGASLAGALVGAGEVLEDGAQAAASTRTAALTIGSTRCQWFNR
jgi:hypothetical protein